LSLKKRNLFRRCLFSLYLMFCTASSVWPIPLSLEQNIKTILADQKRFASGFDFIVVGDNQGNKDVYHRLLDRAKSYNPLFILNTGDCIKEGQSAFYENYQKQIISFDIPILHIPGNHDVRRDGELFQKYVGPPNWYFDLNDIRVIGLDNATGRFSAETIAFARKTLADQKICLVAFHRPPAVEPWDVHAMLEDNQGGRGGEMLDLIKKAKVPLVFMGHIHLYNEMNLEGTTYVIGGGGGERLYNKYDFGRPEFGFVLVRVRPQGITHQWVPLE
jgi:Icc-related predicted phosphoesterase